METDQDFSGHIKTATQEDFDLLADLIRTSFQDIARRFGLTMGNCPKHPSNCTREWIQNDSLRGVQYFVLTDDQLPCGCAGIEKAPDDVCYLERLAVLPDKRGRGFGRQLVHHAIREAREMKMITISIGIIGEQTELADWYETLGFIPGPCKHFPHLPFTVAFMSYSL